MNIAQFSTYPISQGGRRTLMELLQRLFDAKVMTAGSDPSTSNSEGQTLRYMELETQINDLSRLDISHATIDNADVVICHTLVDPLVLDTDTPMVLVHPGIFKELTTLYDETLSTVNDTTAFFASVFRSHTLELLKDRYRAFHTILMNSQYGQKQLQRWYDIDSELVYSPIQYEFFNQADSEKPETGFLYAGRLEWVKGLDICLKACLNAGVSLTVAGGGTYSAEVQEIAQKENKIEYVGQQNKRGLRDLFNESKALVLPSRGEICSSALREALATGTPVIASDIPPNREIMSEDHGCFFPSEDVESLSQRLQTFDASSYASHTLREAVSSYRMKTFEKALTDTINNTVL